MQPIKLRWRPFVAIAVPLFVIFCVYRLYYSSPSCHIGYQYEKALRHVSEYCNDPTKPFTGMEGDVPIKEKESEPFSLESVHVFIRHGDRYLLHDMPNYNRIPLPCKVDQDIIDLVPEMKQYEEAMKFNVERGARGDQQTFHGYDIYPNEKLCSGGWLTAEGAAQHVKNGLFLKSVYLNEHKLLDDENYESQVLVRSTARRRTFQSAMALMYGFLPAFNVAKLTIERATNNTMCVSATRHQCHCPAIVKYTDLFANNFRQLSSDMMASPRVKGVYAHVADVLGVSSSSLPAPAIINDIAMIHFCHYSFSPGRADSCMASWAIKDMYDAVQDNGARQVKTKGYRRMCKLKMQPILYEMVHRMKDQADGKNPLKFVLYSGHDTTIEPLAMALGFSEGKWPMYASRIVFEMYSRPKAGGAREHYVRVIFNGKVVTDKISFCRGDKMADADHGMCRLDHFLDFVDGENLRDLGDTDYAEACTKHISDFEESD